MVISLDLWRFVNYVIYLLTNGKLTRGCKLLAHSVVASRNSNL